MNAPQTKTARYNYAILKENTPLLRLNQESTLLPSPFKKTKYALIEKQIFSDGSEAINRIVYSNDYTKLTALFTNYISYYDYIAMVAKNIQGYLFKLS